VFKGAKKFAAAAATQRCQLLLTGGQLKAWLHLKTSYEQLDLEVTVNYFTVLEWRLRVCSWQKLTLSQVTS